MVIMKEVKEYSKRKRINILKDDGFQAGDMVAILPKATYDDLIMQIQRLNEELIDYRKQGINVNESSEEIDSDVLEQIYQHHQKQLENKDKLIHDKDQEINRLKAITSKYNTAMNGLSLLDMLRRKHKELIDDFQESIWITSDDVLEADVKELLD